MNDASEHGDGMPSKVTNKGQVTVPKWVRDHLGLEPGGAVEFEITEDGGIRLSRTDALPEARRSKSGGYAGGTQAGLSRDEIRALTRGGEDF